VAAGLAAVAGGDDLRHQRRWRGEALHSQVHVHCRLRLAQGAGIGDRRHGRGDAMLHIVLQPRRLRRPEGQRALAGALAEVGVDGLIEMEDAPAGDQVVQGLGDAVDAQPVGVGLDHRQHRHARPPGDGGDVVAKHPQVDLDTDAVAVHATHCVPMAAVRPSCKGAG
jgi:hypothetical protein